MLWREKTKLPEANVPRDWVDAETWLDWTIPQIMVGYHANPEAFERLAGQPADGAAMFPIPVTLIREAPFRKVDAKVAAVARGHRIGRVEEELGHVILKGFDEHGIDQMTVCGMVLGMGRANPGYVLAGWIDRRLSPGPELGIENIKHVESVNWPPR